MTSKAANIGRYAEKKTQSALEKRGIRCVRVDRRKGQLGSDDSFDFKITVKEKETVKPKLEKIDDNGRHGFYMYKSYPKHFKGENKNVKGGFKTIRRWLEPVDLLFITEQNNKTLVVMELDPTFCDLAGDDTEEKYEK